jgi:hypothetical protein
MSSIVEAALHYRRRGWSPIPVPFRSKAPTTLGWTQLRLTEEQIVERFGGRVLNVGVLLGEASDWLIDVDLDHPLCVALADQYLPPTPAVFGRPGKPRSHRLYRATRPVAAKQHKCKSGGTLVELRSTGMQTVFPPSTHESGELITWEVDGAEPAEIDPDELLDAVKRLADSVKIELGEKAAPKPKKRSQSERARPAGPGPAAAADAASGDNRVDRCFQAMLRMEMADTNDGSGRLFAAACRCVEHGLTDDQALQVIRSYARLRPFPTDWTDEHVLDRLRDAERKCQRGKALGETSPDCEDDGARKTQAAVLVELAQVAEFFHFDDDAYVSFEVNDHRETSRVSSKPFRRWLSRRYFEENGKVAGGQATQDAINTLCGQALFAGPELPIAVRTAECDAAYWIDLCDTDRRCVRIDRNGWTVVESRQVPVRFVRRRAMHPLPLPRPGGSISSLRKFVNIQDENDWVLLIAWLIAAMRPRGPYAILNVQGEQGTAKTTLSRILRMLVDPNRAPVRSEPREPRDLMIAASNSRVVAFDNLSNIPVWLSDAMCRLATGGGFSTRELYSDSDEMIFDAMRPIILNGIEPCATRPDLVDRCVTLTLEVIPDHLRRPEEDLFRELESLIPELLGAFYTVISVAMQRLPGIRLASLPRMADFCVWVVAAEPALGLRDGQFLSAYQGDRAAAHELVVESSPVGVAITKLVDRDTRWEGAPAELHLALSIDDFVLEAVRRGPEWPKGARKLSGELRRLAPALRAVGVAVHIPTKRTGREKRLVIVLERSGKQHSAQSAHPATGDSKPETGGDMRSVAGCPAPGHAPQHSASNPVPDERAGFAVGAERAECLSPSRSIRPDVNAEEVIEL